MKILNKKRRLYKYCLDYLTERVNKSLPKIKIESEKQAINMAAKKNNKNPAKRAKVNDLTLITNLFEQNGIENKDVINFAENLTENKLNDKSSKTKKCKALRNNIKATINLIKDNENNKNSKAKKIGNLNFKGVSNSENAVNGEIQIMLSTFGADKKPDVLEPSKENWEKYKSDINLKKVQLNDIPSKM